MCAARISTRNAGMVSMRRLALLFVSSTYSGTPPISSRVPTILTWRRSRSRRSRLSPTDSPHRLPPPTAEVDGRIDEGLKVRVDHGCQALHLLGREVQV